MNRYGPRTGVAGPPGSRIPIKLIRMSVPTPQRASEVSEQCVGNWWSLDSRTNEVERIPETRRMVHTSAELPIRFTNNYFRDWGMTWWQRGASLKPPQHSSRTASTIQMNASSHGCF
eukprot:535829-Pyramimonas_sp.AAC.1